MALAGVITGAIATALLVIVIVALIVHRDRRGRQLDLTTHAGRPGRDRRDRTRTPGHSRRVPTWAIVVAILVVVRVISIVLLLNSGVEDKHSILGGDARRYEAILATHGTPYRDFEVEYPPVTLGLVRLLGSGIDVSGIDPVAGEFDGDLGLLTRLAVVQLGFELGAAALLAWAWNRRTGIAYLILGTPFLFFPFPYVRIDLFSVFLAVLALSLMRKGLDRTGGVALAVAALAKLWPLVLGTAARHHRQASVARVVGDHHGGRRGAVARVLRPVGLRSGRNVPWFEGLADREHSRRLLPHGRPRVRATSNKVRGARAYRCRWS